MALNFGQSLGVTGNIKLTDIDLVSGGYICENGIMTTNNRSGLGVYHDDI